MSSDETNAKMLDASSDISKCIGDTLLTMAAQLQTKYKLTPQQLAVAIVNSQMQLLAAGAAGVMLGAKATNEELHEKAASLLHSIHGVIGDALQVDE